MAMKSKIFAKSTSKIGFSTHEVQIPVLPEEVSYYKTKKTTTIFAVVPLAEQTGQV